MSKVIWEGKRVLITGHTGFKGCWLNKYLRRKGAEVFGLSLRARPQDVLYRELESKAQAIEAEREYFCDIRNKEEVKKAVRITRPEVVFHLAAQPLVIESYREPVFTWETNVIGTLNLLEALGEEGMPCIVVIVTTDKVYKSQDTVKSYVETDELGGSDPYSASKAATELMAYSWVKSFCRRGYKGENIKAATVRAGNVIGGGDWNDKRLVPDVMRAWKKGDVVTLRYPNAVRPWQHVLEPLSGYVRLAEYMMDTSSTGEMLAFNFGPGSDSARTVLEVVNRLKEHIGPLQVDVNIQASHMETDILKLDSKKARRLLRWDNHWDFAKTIRRTASWYKEVELGATAASCMERDIIEHDQDRTTWKS